MKIKKKMKGIGIAELAPIAIALVILVFVISIGGDLIGSVQENDCESPSIWGTYADSNHTNPVNNGYYGCCQSVNTTATICDTWDTSSSSANISQSGLESMEEFGDWLPTLALVIIAAIIIGVLVHYLGGIGGKRKGV